jgi:hypothetical protein
MPSLLLFFKPRCLVLAQFSSIYLFNLSNLSVCTHKWHKANSTIRRILTALYTLKCTRDPLINRSLLCRSPRILQGDFKLYKYNIDVMEKNSAFSKVFISFHYIYPRLRTKSVLAFLMYEHCFLNEIKLSLYPNFYQ